MIRAQTSSRSVGHHLHFVLASTSLGHKVADAVTQVGSMSPHSPQPHVGREASRGPQCSADQVLELLLWGDLESRACEFFLEDINPVLDHVLPANPDSAEQSGPITPAEKAVGTSDPHETMPEAT